MTNRAEFVDTLSRYAKARIPFVTIRSTERKRITEAVREVFDGIGLSVIVHTMTQGMRDLSRNDLVSDERSVVGALEYIGQQVSVRENLTFVLTDVQDLGSDSMMARHLFDVVNLAERMGGMIIVLTTDPVWPTLQRAGMSLTLSPPNRDEMREIVSDFLDAYRGHTPIEWTDADVAEAGTILSGITKLEAENAVATLLASGKILKSDLVELTKIKDRTFSDLAGIERVGVPETLKVGGLDGLQRWLENRRQFLTADLRERNLNPPRGVLLVGVPGCGKSLSAKAVSVTWKLPLYRLDFGSILGMYVGQSENRLREALETVDHAAPCVLWIDEIEKGLSGSGSDSSGVTTRLVGQFLYWLQESKASVFVVATANDVRLLPPELLRKGRFDELFFIDLPTASEREDIIEIYRERSVRGRPFSADLLQTLVKITDGFSGADIEASMREIAMEGYKVGDASVTDDFIRSVFSNTLPMSRTSPERIEEIRAWGRERAVPAALNPDVHQAPGSSGRGRVVLS